MEFCSAADAKVVITATKASIADKVIHLKKNVDEALSAMHGHSICHVLVASEGNLNEPAPDLGTKDIHLQGVGHLCIAINLQCACTRGLR